MSAPTRQKQVRTFRPRTERFAKKIVLTWGITVLLVVAAAGLASAVEQFVRPRGNDAGRNVARGGAVACLNCASERPAEFSWEIANDAKMAEHIDTF